MKYHSFSSCDRNWLKSHFYFHLAFVVQKWMIIISEILMLCEIAFQVSIHTPNFHFQDPDVEDKWSVSKASNLNFHQPLKANNTSITHNLLNRNMNEVTPWQKVLFSFNPLFRFFLSVREGTRPSDKNIEQMKAENWKCWTRFLWKELRWSEEER